MSAPPASLDASPYDEAEILGLITDIYKVLIRQGHFNDKDVVWAPPEGHAIDLSVLDSPDDIDERVVSLMKKLPSGPDACVAPYMRPVSFLNPGELIRSRDIDKYMPGAVDLGRVDQTNALPTVLLLLSGWESTDPVLVLDVASNTIRYFDEVYNGPHYQDFPAESAPAYLKRMLENYYSATWISQLNGGIVKTDQQYPPWGPELRRMLLEDYHWPGDSFRQDDWKRDGRAIVKRMVSGP